MDEVEYRSLFIYNQLARWAHDKIRKVASPSYKIKNLGYHRYHGEPLTTCVRKKSTYIPQRAAQGNRVRVRSQAKR